MEKLKTTKVKQLLINGYQLRSLEEQLSWHVNKNNEDQNLLKNLLVFRKLNQ